MSIGERRFRVTFQRAVITHDSYGEADKKYMDICTSWALITPIKGSERIVASQTQSDLTHRIVTRYRSELSDLDSGDRASWNGKFFDIKAVIWRNHMIKELEILAVEHNK